MADEKDSGGTHDGGPDIDGARGASGTDITGGTDKTGKGGFTNSDAPAAAAAGGTTGVVETGDIMGASSTHAGAGGVMDNTGGAGTAPSGNSVTSGNE